MLMARYDSSIALRSMRASSPAFCSAAFRGSTFFLPPILRLNEDATSVSARFRSPAASSSAPFGIFTTRSASLFRWLTWPVFRAAAPRMMSTLAL